MRRCGAFNEAGGKLDPSARGVDEEEYLPAARLGVTKINPSTEDFAVKRSSDGFDTSRN